MSTTTTRPGSSPVPYLVGAGLTVDGQRSNEGLQVLLVEDDPTSRALVNATLSMDGHTVHETDNAADALDVFRRRDIDVSIVDLGLPDRDGLSLVGDLRSMSAKPILIMSGRVEEDDRVAGLDQGADDYLTKPVAPRELAARVRALGRRSRAPVVGANRVLDFGRLRIDLDAREVQVDETLIDLTTVEFELLAFLAASPRQALSREQLLEQVWHSSSEWQDPATVTEHVRRVRGKIGKACSIATVRGVGYRFDPPNK